MISNFECIEFASFVADGVKNGLILNSDEIQNLLEKYALTDEEKEKIGYEKSNVGALNAKREVARASKLIRKTLASPNKTMDDICNIYNYAFLAALSSKHPINTKKVYYDYRINELWKKYVKKKNRTNKLKANVLNKARRVYTEDREAQVQANEEITQEIIKQVI